MLKRIVLDKLLDIGLAIGLLFLASCSDKDEGEKFKAACQEHEFSPAQCEFLLAMAKHGDDQAMANAAIAGTALGLPVGKGK